MIFLKLVALCVVGGTYAMCIGNLGFYADLGRKRLACLWGVLGAVQAALIVLLVTA